MVVLDNHRSRGDWCCDEAHGDGLWHTPAYPESSWLADWRFMAQRYRHSPQVIAAELRNEIRPDPSQKLSPTWGDGNPATDWQAAAVRGGNAVLAVNPKLLVIVGGLNYQLDLKGVPAHPVTLSVPDRLVYAVHDYTWDHAVGHLTDDAAFAADETQRWGFVAESGASLERSGVRERVGRLHAAQRRRFAVRTGPPDLPVHHGAVPEEGRSRLGLVAGQRDAVLGLQPHPRRGGDVRPAQPDVVRVRQRRPDERLHGIQRPA
ncbi:hypothetical protein GCM10018954_088980 [Kutzneria kofuensis]